MRGDIRSEWDETKQHDVLFLLTLRPPVQAELALLQQDGTELHPAEKFGLAYVRGCEVLEVKDEGSLPLLLTLVCHIQLALSRMTLLTLHFFALKLWLPLHC